MAWRNHETHREESNAVKNALAAEGIKARVGHGTGTAWGWLEIHTAAPSVLHDTTSPGSSVIVQTDKPSRIGGGHCVGNCDGCAAVRETSERINHIARTVTGRHGEYGGNINVYLERG